MQKGVSKVKAYLKEQYPSWLFGALVGLCFALIAGLVGGAWSLWPIALVLAFFFKAVYTLCEDTIR